MKKKHSIELVSSPKKQPAIQPNTRLTSGDFIADLFIDSRQGTSIYHWIIQRVGSAEILRWGQEKSFADAESAARSCLATLAGQNRGRDVRR